jgi:hypothetical protein
MPNYVEIYFGPDDRERVAGKVSSALRIPFEPSAKPYADYLGRTEDLALDFKVDHDLEDEAGIPFEGHAVRVDGPGLPARPVGRASREEGVR